MSLVFRITDESSNVYTVTPVNEDIIFTDTKENDQVFFRRKINDLIFIADDYNTLKGFLDLNDCENYELSILHQSTERWLGVLNLRKGDWQDRICKLEIPVEPKDPASRVLSMWELKANVFSAASTITAYPFIGEIECEECVDTAVASPPDFPLSSLPTAQCDTPLLTAQGWTITRNEVNGVVQVSTSPPLYEAQLNVITRYCREFVAGSLPPGSGWVAVTGGYARTVVTILDNNKSDFDPEDGKLLQYYNVVGLDTETGDQQPIDNGVLVADLLNYFVLEAGLTQVVSDFLNINPDMTAPTNSSYTAANPNLHYLAIFQNSDVKRPGAYENASRGEVSFKELLEMLREVFQIYWRVEGDNLRLEHISYFEANNGLDLTTNAPVQINNLNNFTWKENKLAAIEKFRWAYETQIRDFAGLPITYDDGCADPELSPIDHNPGPFYTDIQTMQRMPQLVGDQGFTLANLAFYSGKYYFIQETGVLSGTRWVNGHLSWANLHSKYWRFGRPFASGQMNGSTTAFFSIQKLKQQEPLKVPLSTSDYFDTTPEDNIQSELGWGAPEKLEYSTKRCLLTVTLTH